MNGAIIPVKEEIYSSTETPIGVYGNKTLYRRVINFGSVSASTDTVVLNDASLLGVDVISLTGTGIQSDSSIVNLGHYYDSTSYSAIWFRGELGTGRIFVRNKSALSGGYVTLIYAK